MIEERVLRMQLSVVVPVHNERDNLRSLVEEIHRALADGPEFELLYVDDGSTDCSGNRLQELQVEYPRLRVLRHREVCGQSTATRTGVKAAVAPVVATLDGDGQNDPADILRLYAILTDPAAPQGLEMVVGHRRRRRDAWPKRLASLVANGVRRRLLRDGTPDTGCGLKVFYRQAFLELPYFDHMHRFLPALIQRNGGGVISRPVNHRARTAGATKYGIWGRLWVGVPDLVGVMWLQRRGGGPRLGSSGWRLGSALADLYGVRWLQRRSRRPVVEEL
jgi:dolichol-phosphate mannosyltransferase